MAQKDLIPFKKGDPESMKYRINKPKGPHMTTLFKKYLKVKIKAKDPKTQELVDMPLAHVCALATIQQAAKGNVKAMALILERLEGKVVDRHEHTGKDGQPLASLPPLQVVVNGVDGSEEPSE